MSTVYAKPGHVVVRDGDIVALDGRTFSIAVHDQGKNSEPYASIIPQACVISAVHFEKDRPVASIDFGAILHVVGMGPFTVYRNRQNRDWPHFIPASGPRYYYRFEGFDQWRIMDRTYDYSDKFPPVIETAAIREMLGMHRYAIRNQYEAQAIASILNMQDAREQ